MNSNWFKLVMKMMKVEYGKNLLLKGVPIIFNKGGAKLKIGENVTIKSSFLSNLVGLYSRTIIVIGNDVWIGNRVMIKAGVNIADGAVIGMGSIVTKDIGPYEIWAGNPARMIRKRFDDETIAALEEMKWWNWNDEKIELSSGVMTDVAKFIGMRDKKQ